MKKVLACLLLALIGGSVQSGDDMFTTGNPKWDACAKKALDAAVAECEKYGYLSDRCNASNVHQMVSLSIMECGYAPAPKKIPKWHLESLGKSCVDKQRLSEFAAYETFWEIYDSAYRVQLQKVCENIYLRKESNDARLAEERTWAEKRRKEKHVKDQAKAKARASGFWIARVYSNARGWTRAVIETNKRRQIKCAALDANHEYLTAEEFIVTPPVDEVIFAADAAEVKCWY